LVTKVFLQDSPQRARAGFERKFRQQTDPWKYNSPEGGERLRRALEILDRARGEKRFPQALEIGCAEGTFTAMLASRCDSLLAVDISPTALDRARTRCNAVSHVRFAEWDLRRDTPTDVFDLVVVMDVLTYFARLSALREARDKLVAAARPGGYLLIANPRQAEIFETAWWGRRLLRGGKWINTFMAEHHDLRLVTAVTDNSSVYTLLRKVS